MSGPGKEREHMVMEVDASGTDLAGQSAARPGVHQQADSVLTSTGYTGGTGLSQRLTAVARLVQIGSVRGGADGFTTGLIEDAETLLARAGERLRLSAHHTIVVLAGGTGSGKSSLFNALAGARFSEVGVLRPVTREPLACVWGMEGAGPLLDWLGIKPRCRYARSSALDEGERALTGLLLVDLPDHDSVLSRDSAEVRRLVAQADLMVWVLDPQKYADAAVHSRYLMPMAGHSSVIAVALNQADLLTAEQVDDCVFDLRRLLDAEGLHDIRVVVTSATTGVGVPDLSKVLMDTVIARQAAMQRIGADVDALALRFVPYAGEVGGAALREPASDLDGQAEPSLPVATTDALAEAFSRAAGVSGVGKTLESARELRAVDYVGWPVAWLADRMLRRDPVRKARLRTLWEELRGASAGSIGAQQAEINNAVNIVADKAGQGLPAPWQASIRNAARSRTHDIPAALGAAIAESLPAENSVAPWWRAVAAVQGLLLGGAALCVAWLLAIIVVGGFHAVGHASPLLHDLTLLPWVALLTAALLLLGWLTASGCMSLVVREADQERERGEQAMNAAIAGVARQMVLAPVERELSELARFRAELAVARSAI
jgi:energy-coupling factor transporter ATP-binding protein EcfA2/type IV secretory pathway VirB2 component (pilin)